MDYQQRLNVLNSDADKRTVLESIDRPIRGLILAMHLIGMKTTFSCCGFNYDGEEEPKSHSDNGPFVVFHGPSYTDLNSTRTFHAFAWYAYQCGWSINMYNAGGGPNPVLWVIRYEMDPRQKTFYKQVDGIKAIHDYELPLIAIHRLEKSLAQMPMVDAFTIVDGNANYEGLGGEWQIKPKQPYTYKKEVPVEAPTAEVAIDATSV